jgi:hypothetical protein
MKATYVIAAIMFVIALVAIAPVSAANGNTQVANQLGLGNGASQSVQYGMMNHQALVQAGLLNSGTQAIKGVSSFNVQASTQVGNLNKDTQTVKNGFSNVQTVGQFGSFNSASQTVTGSFNYQSVSQVGTGNHAVQTIG